MRNNNAALWFAMMVLASCKMQLKKEETFSVSENLNNNNYDKIIIILT